MTDILMKEFAQEIELSRRNLYLLVEKKGGNFLDPEVIKSSIRLDKLILSVQKHSAEKDKT